MTTQGIDSILLDGVVLYSTFNGADKPTPGPIKITLQAGDKEYAFFISGLNIAEAILNSDYFSPDFMLTDAKSQKVYVPINAIKTALNL